MWISIIVGVTVLLIIVMSAAKKYEQDHYIPDDEKWEMYLRPNEYKPWSKSKRMKYYNKEKKYNSIPGPIKRKYRSTIETGYYNRRY